jgi:hypothetical protein
MLFRHVVDFQSDDREKEMHHQLLVPRQKLGTTRSTRTSSTILMLVALLQD